MSPTQGLALLLQIDVKIIVVRNKTLHRLRVKQTPAVFVQRPVEQIRVVNGTQTVTAGQHGVVGDFRCPAHTLPPHVIAPGLAWHPRRVQGVVHQYRAARQPRRRQYPRVVVQVTGPDALRVEALIVIGKIQTLTRADAAVAAAGAHRQLTGLALHENTAPAQQMVPHRLTAAVTGVAVRYGERDTAERSRNAALGKRRPHRIGGGIAIHPIRRRRGAAAAVDRQVKAVGIAADHRRHALRQVRLVLGQVAGVDAQQRLIRRRHSTALAAPGRDRQRR